MHSRAHAGVLAFIIVGTIVSLILGSIVIRRDRMPQQPEAVQTFKQPPSKRSTEAIEKVDAAELLGTYDSNPIAANADFRGRYLDVRGRIQGIRQGFIHDEVILDAGIDLDFHRAYFVFSSRFRDQLQTLRRGAWVTIRGRCQHGDRFSARLVDCSLP